MKQQKYLIFKDGVRKVESRTQAPKGLEWYLAPANLEHPDDADIIEETDEFGNTRKVVKINEQKKEARLNAEAQKRQQAIQKREDERQLRRAVKSRMAAHLANAKAANSTQELQQTLIQFIADVEKAFKRLL